MHCITALSLDSCLLIKLSLLSIVRIPFHPLKQIVHQAGWCTWPACLTSAAYPPRGLFKTPLQSVGRFLSPANGPSLCPSSDNPPISAQGFSSTNRGCSPLPGVSRGAVRLITWLHPTSCLKFIMQGQDPYSRKGWTHMHRYVSILISSDWGHGL